MEQTKTTQILTIRISIGEQTEGCVGMAANTLCCSCRCYETAPEQMAVLEEQPRDRKKGQRQKAKYTSSPMNAQFLIHLNSEQRKYRSHEISDRSIGSESYYSVSAEPCAKKAKERKLTRCSSTGPI